ncbi:HPt (histidine-containing phosphotransfer) domain-containing protein [Aequitasia blattaphilus]|uniref:Hpt domain-containing protein n=1 Tax=Aequitasia blattaphilus TaxID=2949332 RepID=A0ABT1EA88_9FIRM|nr:Hpt domain-containing protein [Aequitasia blattaphilus]MCP1101422.1 Hpt domain-containing protein [Aequitasia blattaphilus]MCR8614062.1 Hpt domain-containing protein [Aequitasia blattaphilus]
MSELLTKLTNYGADVNAALERFGGDASLFETCFYMLIEDENFANLGKYMKEKNYEEAFKCAHALKGVVGNLEITPLYQSISSLVESLRAQNYEDIDSIYHQIETDYQSLLDI